MIKTLWYARKPWQKGFLVGVAFLLLGFLYMVITLSLGYDGTCGLMPFLGANECSFFEYLIPLLNFSLAVIFSEFWWVLVIIVATSTLIGFIGGLVYRKNGSS